MRRHSGSANDERPGGRALAHRTEGSPMLLARADEVSATTYSKVGYFACFGGAEYPDSWRGEAPLCVSYGCLFGTMSEAARLTLGARKGSKTVIHGYRGEPG